MLNVNIGGSRGGNYRGTISSSKASTTKENVGAFKSTDDIKAVNVFIKSLNVVAFNYPGFAYHFVARAPGPVIKNFFKAFEAVANVLAERLDNDACNDQDEYDCAIASKRISDALGKYKG